MQERDRRDQGQRRRPVLPERLASDRPEVRSQAGRQHSRQRRPAHAQRQEQAMEHDPGQRDHHRHRPPCHLETFHRLHQAVSVPTRTTEIQHGDLGGKERHGDHGRSDGIERHESAMRDRHEPGMRELRSPHSRPFIVEIDPVATEDAQRQHG